MGSESGTSEVNHRTDAFAFVHQVKGVIDLFKLHVMSDKDIQRNLSGLGLFHVARQLGAAFYPAERRAFPDSARDQLERTGADLLPSASHPDDGRFAPALKSALQRRAHQIHGTDAL